MNTFTQFEEFKFRVWWKKQKRYLRAPVLIFGKVGASCEIFEEGNLAQCVRVEETDIERPTGLKDKNGNLIYESDRVKLGEHIGIIKWGTYNNGDWGDENAILGFYIEWQDTIAFRQDLAFYCVNKEYELEIISNVHTEEQK